MSQERPRGAPLHGKRVYAYIGQTGGGALDYVSFATEFNLNLSAQNTSRAVIMGTDAVPDVETHGLVARLRLNLYLTSTESDFLLALGGEAAQQDLAQHDVDYDKGVRNLLAKKSYLNSSRLDILVAPLENIPVSPDSSLESGVLDLDTLRSKPGYIIELNAAAITALEITSRIGEYTTARLEVESGRYIINAVEDAA